MGNSQLAIDNGQWTMDNRQWATSNLAINDKHSQLRRTSHILHRTFILLTPHIFYEVNSSCKHLFPIDQLTVAAYTAL